MLKLLADETRLRVICALLEGEHSVNELAELVGRPACRGLPAPGQAPPGPPGAQPAGGDPDLLRARRRARAPARRRGALARRPRDGAWLTTTGEASGTATPMPPGSHRWRPTAAPCSTALVLLVAFMAFEVGAAVASNSLVLLADAGHMLVDVGAIAGSLVAIRLAARPETGSHTYGMKRAEILAAAGNAIALLIVSALVTYDAVVRLVHPSSVDGAVLIVVAAVGVAVNLAATLTMARANRRSLNVEGAYRHILTDLYGFIGTLIAGHRDRALGLRPGRRHRVAGRRPLHVEGGGGAAAPGAAHPARGDPGGHRRRGGASTPDGAARGAVGARPPRLDPHLVAADPHRPRRGHRRVLHDRRGGACPRPPAGLPVRATSTWRTRRCSSSRPGTSSTSSAGTPDERNRAARRCSVARRSGGWLPAPPPAPRARSSGRCRRRAARRGASRRRAGRGGPGRTRTGRRRRRRRVRTVGACASSARMTSVPAPSRAGSRTTMSGRPSAGRHQRRRHLALQDAQVGEGGAVVAGVGAGAPVPLDGEDRSRRAHRVGQGDGEQAGAGVEVDDRRHPLQSPATSRTAREQRRRGAPVDLPEDAGRDPVGAAADGGVHRAGRPADLPSDDHAGADVGQARRRLAAWRDRDHRLGRIGARRDLELGGAGPQLRQGAGRADTADWRSGSRRRTRAGGSGDAGSPRRRGRRPPTRTRVRQPSPSASPAHRLDLDLAAPGRPGAPAARRCGRP